MTESNTDFTKDIERAIEICGTVVVDQKAEYIQCKDPIHDSNLRVIKIGNRVWASITSDKHVYDRSFMCDIIVALRLKIQRILAELGDTYSLLVLSESLEIGFDNWDTALMVMRNVKGATFTDSTKADNSEDRLFDFTLGEFSVREDSYCGVLGHRIIPIAGPFVVSILVKQYTDLLQRRSQENPTEEDGVELNKEKKRKAQTE